MTVPVLTVEDLAGMPAGSVPTGPDALRHDGTIEHPVVLIDLDSLPDRPSAALIGRAAARVWLLPQVTIGYTTRLPSLTARPLLEALCVSTGPFPHDSAAAAVGGDGTASLVGIHATTVPSKDPQAAAAELAAAVKRQPLAGVTLQGLLRQTSLLPVAAGVAAESATYSMLLAGPEFAHWLAVTDCPAPPDNDDEAVLATRTDDHLTLTFNRPDRRNAYGRGVRDALLAGLEVALHDPQIRKVSIRGAGTTFCSGGDLGEFGTAPDPATAHLVRLARNAGRTIDLLGEKVEVFVHGTCVGAGVEIPAFACKVTAAPDTTFRLPEVAMGLVPGAGGTVSITRRIGRWRTAWLALTGYALPSTTALNWGLVDRIAA
jgi:hypothetical protein